MNKTLKFLSIFFLSNLYSYTYQELRSAVCKATRTLTDKNNNKKNKQAPINYTDEQIIDKKLYFILYEKISDIQFDDIDGIFKNNQHKTLNKEIIALLRLVFDDLYLNINPIDNEYKNRLCAAILNQNFIDDALYRAKTNERINSLEYKINILIFILILLLVYIRFESQIKTKFYQLYKKIKCHIIKK